MAKNNVNRYYSNNNISATFGALAFGNSVSEPVKITLRLEKRDIYWNDTYLRDVVCYYDVPTQNVWMDEQDASYLTKNYEIEDFLCAYVKRNLDIVFSATEDSEKRLVEILCQEEGILLGAGIYPIITTQYSLYYKEGMYELRIPVLGGGGMTADKMDELCQRAESSTLSWDFAWTLNWILLRDPSFLNREYMRRREPGKRNGTNVVREFQKKVEAVLAKAEKYVEMVNAYRTSLTNDYI